MTFHGRERELGIMDARYREGAFECFVVYGRRRVGKTALIGEFCKDKPTIFFSALDTTAGENLVYLSRAIQAFSRPEAAFAPFASYDDAFAEISRLAEKERLVFVIDEYPYLAKADPAVSSRLQHLIDHVWQRTQLCLILCGSSMGFMQRQVLGAESPLFGRRTAQFPLAPLDYRETALFCPGLSLEDRALVYGITGGVPHYINKLDAKTSVDRALLANLFERSAYLYEEPGNLLKQELREPAVSNAIISAIAGGASRLNEIATKVHETTSACTARLAALIELGIVVRETPVTEKPGRKTIYLLRDSFFRFWYKFVPAAAGLIESGRLPALYDIVIKPHLPEFMGLVFERMCRDYLLFHAKDLPFPIRDIGQWWGTDPVRRKEVQIDLLASSATSDDILFASCKYTNAKVGLDELALLRSYAAVYRGSGPRHFFLFSKAGFTPDLALAAARGEATLIRLSDLYA